MEHLLKTEAAHIRAQLENAQYLGKPGSQTAEQQTRIWELLHAELIGTAERLEAAAAKCAPIVNRELKYE